MSTIYNLQIREKEAKRRSAEQPAAKRRKVCDPNIAPKVCEEGSARTRSHKRAEKENKENPKNVTEDTPKKGD